jgi:hypothetical protein
MKKLQHGRKRNWIANLSLHVLRSYLLLRTLETVTIAQQFFIFTKQFHIIIIYKLMTFLWMNGLFIYL